VTIIINVSTCRKYVSLRILLGLEALSDQTAWDNSQYRKVQGFIYDKLIANTEFKDIHNLKGYKLFCFSNIFPPSLVKRGQLRHLLFSSPNNDLVKSVFSQTKENLMDDDKEINIGEQQYNIKSLELLETRITSNRCIIRTSTPVSVRIPQRSYSNYNIDKEKQKESFIYWRSDLPQEIFLNLIINNMKSKYEYFYKRHVGDIESIIESITFLKEVVIHLPIEDYTIKVPASFWRLRFKELQSEFKRRFLNFMLDVGIGERNSAGLGFLNIEEGARTIRLAVV
jgi:CRISPR-associated endoribonuclease Cas6